MEERIIDDEYGRGVRLRKTKDGYVDVTDELTEKDSLQDGETAQEEMEEEIAFEFPEFATDEDDEELATLTPEQAQELIRRREEEERIRKENYENACAEGEALLNEGSYKAAELKFEKALMMDEIATQATVGYWRAKTANFTQPDVIADEYAGEGVDALEHDLGVEALKEIKKSYYHVFEQRVAELDAEEKPLMETVEEKRAKRHVILKERLKRSSVIACIFALPVLAFLVLAIVFGLKNFSTKGDEYVVLTIIFGSLFFICLIVEAIQANKAINDWRMYRANQRLRSTDEGKQLWTIQSYKAFYEELLSTTQEKNNEE